MISYIFSAITFIFLILNMIFIKKDNQKIAFVFKVLASISFVITGILSFSLSTINTSKILILVGLIFGFIGDVVLGLKVTTVSKKRSELYFILGVLSFGLGHLFYSIGLYLYNKNLIYLLISLLIALVFSACYQFIMKKFKFEIKGLELALFTYSLIITMTVSYGFMISSSNLNLLIVTFGVLFIMISDVILSIVYFTSKKSSLNLQALNHLIYYLGQILISLSLLFI